MPRISIKDQPRKLNAAQMASLGRRHIRQMGINVPDHLRHISLSARSTPIRKGRKGGRKRRRGGRKSKDMKELESVERGFGPYGDYGVARPIIKWKRIKNPDKAWKKQMRTAIGSGKVMNKETKKFFGRH